MSSSRQSSGSPGRTLALLSIRPAFATAILEGEKRYEYRRVAFSRRVDTVLIYVTTPVQQIVAEFDVLAVITEPLRALWRRTKHQAGITEEVFLSYFDGMEYGHAIAIGDVRTYSKPLSPVQDFGLRPPQSFAYVASA